VLNRQAVVLNEGAINHQPNDLLFYLEQRFLESVTDAGAEALQPFRQAKFLLPVPALALDLAQPLTQRPTMPSDVYGRPSMTSIRRAGRRANWVAASPD
jgi:hypothetical protein